MDGGYGLVESAMAHKVKEPKAPGKKKIKEMHIKFAKGGAHITHVHEHPAHPNEEHVVAMKHEGDLDGLHDHLEHHVGAPNPGEEASESGDEAMAEAVGAAPEGGKA